MTLVLNGRPEVLAMDPPNVAYLTVNRHNIVYGAKVDFSKGDPPYIARVTIEQEGGQLTGVCDVVDTQTGSAAVHPAPEETPSPSTYSLWRLEPTTRRSIDPC